MQFSNVELSTVCNFWILFVSMITHRREAACLSAIRWFYVTSFHVWTPQKTCCIYWFHLSRPLCKFTGQRDEVIKHLTLTSKDTHADKNIRVRTCLYIFLWYPNFLFLSLLWFRIRLKQSVCLHDNILIFLFETQCYCFLRLSRCSQVVEPLGSKVTLDSSWDSLSDFLCFFVLMSKSANFFCI